MFQKLQHIEEQNSNLLDPFFRSFRMLKSESRIQDMRSAYEKEVVNDLFRSGGKPLPDLETFQS